MVLLLALPLRDPRCSRANPLGSPATWVRAAQALESCSQALAAVWGKTCLFSLLVGSKNPPHIPQFCSRDCLGFDINILEVTLKTNYCLVGVSVPAETVGL